MVTEQETRALNRVLEMLGSGQATSQHLEDYVIGYQVLGNLCALAQAEVETAELNTKVSYAEEFAKAKEDGASDTLAKAKADIAVTDLRKKEIKARERNAKLKSTRESVWEAINAIKFLGRNGG